jgi:hypothetical protein
MHSIATPSTVRFDAPVVPSPRSAVRLTRRGRVVIVLALLTVAFLAFTLGRVGSSQAATEPGTRVPYAQTTVHRGETLWAVARRVAPGHDPREVVEQIRVLNHLTGSLQAGQQLLLPRAA